MAQITDPLVVKWSNEQLRPMAERMVALKLAAEQMQAQWNGGVSAALSGFADGDTIADNAAASGSNPITKAEATAMQAQFNTQITTMQVAFYMDNFNLAIVRALSSLFSV